MIDLEFLPIDFAIAELIGKARHDNARARDVKNIGISTNLEAADRDGAICEAALARYLDVYFHGTIGKTNARDVACLQVRSTRREPPVLILRPRDREKRGEHPFVLMIVRGDVVSIVGWIERGNDFMIGEPTETFGKPDRAPCWAVPIEKLRDPAEIKPRFMRWRAAKLAKELSDIDQRSTVDDVKI